jgi:catechol 2,3-dioxygenase-like lactoylglutathione lyase family enzyme
MSTATTRIGRIHLVMIPSSDQDRSIAFYEALGFEKRADAPFGEGHRWVELFPPDGTAGIALAPGQGEGAGVQTGIILTTDDIDATHAELRSAGVDVDAEVARVGAAVEIRIGAADVVGPEP